MNFRECAAKIVDMKLSKSMNAVFLGDSVTHGVFEISEGKNNTLNCVFDYQNVYHEIFKRMFNMIYPVIPLNCINAGINGGSALQGLERLEKDVLSYSPDLVVVCFGLNDAHGGIENVTDYINSLEKIFDKLKSENIETIFMSPNMMNTYVVNSLKEGLIAEIARKTALLQNNGIMDYYMECAKDVCINKKIQICDCYNKWKLFNHYGVDTTLLLSNYINHPIREMHWMFAEMLFHIVMFNE